MLNVQKRIKLIVTTGLMTTFVFITTVLGIHIGPSYFNLGDSVIYIASAILGPIGSAFAGGIGSCFADLYVYPLTAPYTLFIKAFEGLFVGIAFSISKRLLKKNQLLATLVQVIGLFVGATIMVAGYFFAKWFFYGRYETALISLTVTNIPQAVISITIACVLLYGKKLLKLLNPSLQFL